MTKRDFICTCGTRFETQRAFSTHKGHGAWHKVARTARALRRHGLSYREIGRQTATNTMTIWFALKKEGL